MHGPAEFSPAHLVTNSSGDVIEREPGRAREFLVKLAPILAEPLVIETISVENLRFPMAIDQWKVWPNGLIIHDSLDHDVPSGEMRELHSLDIGARIRHPDTGTRIVLTGYRKPVEYNDGVWSYRPDERADYAVADSGGLLTDDSGVQSGPIDVEFFGSAGGKA